MKLSVRLAAALSVLGVLVVATVAALAWFASAQEIREATDESLGDSRDVLRSFLESDVFRDFQQNPTPDGRAFDNSNGESGVIPVLSGGVVDPDALFVLPPAKVTQVLTGVESFETLSIGGRTYRTLTASVDPLPLGTDGSVSLEGALLYQDITSEEEALADLAFRLALVGFIAVVVVAIGSWFIGRRLARPLVELTDAVEYLGSSGGTVQRIELDRSDEIGRLADRFNAMLAALEVGREQQHRLVTDASHELRTPLTALRLRAEYAASFETLTPEQRSVVEGAVGDLEQLSALVADLVDLATDASPTDEEAERAELASVVEPLAQRTAVATGRSITIEADDSVAVVYPTMIKRAVQNLVDNAVKYSPDGEPIVINIDDGTITVRDRGSGIADEDLEFVFDRFFRSPKARNRPGNGIGLAIVKQVAELHNGAAFATSRPGEGASVGFSVPGLAAP